MTPEDRKRVEEIRRAVNQYGPDIVTDMLAIIDRVDPQPPPERIVVSEKAKHEFWKHQSLPFAVDTALRAAFKVMLAENISGAMVAMPVTSGNIYKAITGEEWPG